MLVASGLLMQTIIRSKIWRGVAPDIEEKISALPAPVYSSDNIVHLFLRFTFCLDVDLYFVNSYEFRFDFCK